MAARAGIRPWTAPRGGHGAAGQRLGLYRTMVRIRMVEETLADLWQQGLISGEMHLGIGEEAAVAGVCAHLRDGDAVALDHRSTPALVARGCDLLSLFLEVLGDEDGMCRGVGGHMHLFASQLRMASTGIVGATAPLGAGFALAAQTLRPRSVAVAFLGDGSLNQGMVMEAFNLAAVWRLPVLFVCKDNGWAIVTRSSTVTAGAPAGRARALGLATGHASGRSVDDVLSAAGPLVERARRGLGAGFLHVQCARPAGHFLGDPLLQLARHPVRESRATSPPLVRAMRERRGAPRMARLQSVASIGRCTGVAAIDMIAARWSDPLRTVRRSLPVDAVERCEREVRAEIDEAVLTALARRGRRA